MCGRRPVPRPRGGRAHRRRRRPRAPAHVTRPHRHRAHPRRRLRTERHRHGATRERRPEHGADRRGPRSARPHDLGAAHPARDPLRPDRPHHGAGPGARHDRDPRSGTGGGAGSGDLAQHRHRHPERDRGIAHQRHPGDRRRLRRTRRTLVPGAGCGRRGHHAGRTGVVRRHRRGRHRRPAVPRGGRRPHRRSRRLCRPPRPRAPERPPPHRRGAVGDRRGRPTVTKQGASPSLPHRADVEAFLAARTAAPVAN